MQEKQRNSERTFFGALVAAFPGGVTVSGGGGWLSGYGGGGSTHELPEAVPPPGQIVVPGVTVGTQQQLAVGVVGPVRGCQVAEARVPQHQQGGVALCADGAQQCA